MPLSKEGRRVRAMFAGIARRYDLLNHVLSLNIDRRWRRRAARRLALDARSRVLDVCTGTGDLAFELARHLAPDEGWVHGTDFCPEMVTIAEEKRKRRAVRNVAFSVADTLALPFPDGAFDAVTVAFGIRNVESLDRGLAEMARVLRPGGRLAILEFTASQRRPIRAAYRLYFHRLLPRIGAWISRSRAGEDAYAYLPASVDEFPGPEELGRRMEQAGFAAVRWDLLSFGIAALHVGE
ncbi:MAG TPA: bifunctional demethylmenaquinone methyltransferase/2-methoxy-6-polyprenyl-1,4-benzoquinol methylase UbiE, partial [Planctomycetota bacterium]|nr:bifunctional demethylmenaquinone methyltransferase/2-methoxy-6-polyprenyl-1,4-benzoquinol methylase UbiE [Planctomycetota bacterium]